MYSGDMIVNLTTLSRKALVDSSIRLKRAFPGDKKTILEFVKNNFQESWIYEAEQALMQSPSKCFIATREGEVVGFACYDASAKGFFGPIGVLESQRGQHLGEVLLIRTLEAMREYGYGYAIIGWVSDAAPFYKKTIGAEFIKGGEPENSIYSNLVSMK